MKSPLPHRVATSSASCRPTGRRRTPASPRRRVAARGQRREAVARGRRPPRRSHRRTSRRDRARAGGRRRPAARASGRPANDMPSAGWRESMPKPLRWPWIASSVERRSACTAESPHQLRLTIDAAAAFALDQVGVAAHRVDVVGDVERHHHAPAACGPGSARTRAITARTRSPSGACAGIGADLVVLDEVDAGVAELGRRARRSARRVRPTFGLMIVPSSGRSATPVERRVPAMPWRGSLEARAIVGAAARATAAARRSPRRDRRDCRRPSRRASAGSRRRWRSGTTP